MNVPGWLMTVAMLMSLSIGRALAGETATAVATITAGFVTGITVTSGGSGYTSEPAVTLTGGGGSGATAKAILSEDKVAAVVVLTFSIDRQARRLADPSMLMVLKVAASL